MAEEPTMAMLRPSRKKPRPGDIFTLHMPAIGFVFGRVVIVDLESGPVGPGSILVYLYNHLGKTKHDFGDEALTRENLLLAPIMINRLPWSRGYFETVANQPLRDSDVLEQHCFFDLLTKKIVDLDGSEIEECDGPCGDWGLDSYMTVDIRLRKVYGLPSDDPGPPA